MEYPGESPDVLYTATQSALSIGIRCFDTAELYSTLPAVGRALSESKIDRKELRLISKLSGLPSGDYKDVEIRARQLCAALQTSYVDLLLIHWPGPRFVDLGGNVDLVGEQCNLEFFKANIQQAWENMQRLQKSGLCNEIGVSNFYSQHFHAMDTFSAPVPAACQIFIDPLHQETEFVSALQERGVKVMAYRSATFLPIYEMAAGMGDASMSALQTALAAVRDTHPTTSLNQLVWAWCLTRGIEPVVKSRDAARLREALEAHSLAAVLATKTDAFASFTLLNAPGAADTVEICGGFDEYARAFRGTS